MQILYQYEQRPVARYKVTRIKRSLRGRQKLSPWSLARNGPRNSGGWMGACIYDHPGSLTHTHSRKHCVHKKF